MGKFVIRETNTGIKFDLKAGNGEVIGTSEVYTTKVACENGIKSVKTNALIAEIEDQTIKDFKTVKHPKYQVFEDKVGEIHFRLKAKNGEIILASEGYKAKAACINGIESVKKNAPEGQITHG